MFDKNATGTIYVDGYTCPGLKRRNGDGRMAQSKYDAHGGAGARGRRLPRYVYGGRARRLDGARFDLRPHMVGVSAGAAFGYNFKSRQIGRAIRYNKAYCADKRYASVTSWLRTGDMFNADFAYHEVPIERDPIDLEAYRACPMRFTCVCTDIETGKAVYHDLPYGDERDIEWSGRRRQFPVATRPVAIEAASTWMAAWLIPIPSAWLFAQGMTQYRGAHAPAGLVKQPNSVMPMLRRVFRHYPEFVAALEHRHEVYNATLDDLARREAAGRYLCGASERIGESAVAVPRAR